MHGITMHTDNHPYLPVLHWPILTSGNMQHSRAALWAISLVPDTKTHGWESRIQLTLFGTGICQVDWRCLYCLQ